jgi:hypothetical protein
MIPSASKTALFFACQHWTRDDVERHDVAREDADRGTRFHAAIAALVNGQPHDVEDDVRAEYDAAVTWLRDKPQFRAEVAYEWEPDTGLARELPDAAGRAYPNKPGHGYGTADLVHVSEADGVRRGIVADWKTGDGRGASAQLRTLATVAAYAHELDEVTVYALEVSPHGVTEVCRETLTVRDCVEHEEQWAAALAARDNAQPNPGAHCTERFCPARASCPATREGLEQIEQIIGVESLVSKHRLSVAVESPDHAAWMLERIRLVESACDQIKATIKAAVPPDGWELSDGRTLRETYREVTQFQREDALALLRSLGATETQVAATYKKVVHSGGLRVSGGQAKTRKKRVAA